MNSDPRTPEQMVIDNMPILYRIDKRLESLKKELQSLTRQRAELLSTYLKTADLTEYNEFVKLRAKFNFCD